METSSFNLIISILGPFLFGYGVYESWFKTWELSEDEIEEMKKNHPIFQYWHLSKGKMWFTKIGSIMGWIWSLISLFMVILK